MSQEEYAPETYMSAMDIIAYKENGKIKTGFMEIDEQKFIGIVQRGNPGILSEVIKILDSGITPRNIRPGSHKRVVCVSRMNELSENENIVVWTQFAYNIERKGCPYLSRKARGVWRGYNDLATVRPDVAAQWDYQKNYPLTPSDVSYGSTKKVWWCMDYTDELTNSVCHYEWDSTIYHRTSHNEECPHIKHSKLERKVCRLLKEMGISFKTEAKLEGCEYKGQLRFDIYIPDHNVAIEVDGLQHFQAVDFFGGMDTYIETINRDFAKNNFCMNNEIRLLRIPYIYIDNKDSISVSGIIRQFLESGNVSSEIVNFYQSNRKASYVECVNGYVA